MIVVNGQERAMEGRTIAELLDALDVPGHGRGVAVAVDAEVVPKSEWASYVVEDGANVEVVTAVQGG